MSNSGITENFYRLTAHLKCIENFLKTLNRLDIITKDEMRVIYSSTHFRTIEKFKKMRP